MNTKNIKAYIKALLNEDKFASSAVISVILVVVIFSIGYIMGAASKTTVEKVQAGSVDTTASTIIVTTTAATTAAPVESTTAVTVTSTAAPIESTQNSQPQSSAPSSLADILALYNESANKVKVNASKITKNYEDREVLNLTAPSLLQSLADKVIGEVMVDDTVPVDYATAEDIKANFIVPNQDYVSKLTEADVVEATCTDNGTEYEIMIKTKDEVNPTAGVGVGAGFDVIESAEIMSSSYASMLNEFTVTYSECVIKCKIDKATGNMVWANYKTPVQLDVSVNAFGTHEASVGISFEKDYTIVY